MRQIVLAVSVVALVSVVVSCGGGKGAAAQNGDADPNVDPQPFNGIYRVVSHTRNATACDSEGPEISGGHPFFKLEESIISERSAVLFYVCAQIDTCDPDPTDGWFRNATTGSWENGSEALMCGCFTPCSGDCCTLNLDRTIGSLQQFASGRVRIETLEKSATIKAPTCDQPIAADDPALICGVFEALSGERVN